MISLLVVLWSTSVLTFGLKAYWIHSLLLLAVVLFFVNMNREK
jgi:hypothetical protein